MSRLNDKELKSLVVHINSLLGVSSEYGVKGSIFLSHRYEYRAIDKFTGNHCDTCIESGLSAREAYYVLKGILAGLSLARERDEREVQDKLARIVKIEGFSNYETAMCALAIANDKIIHDSFQHALKHNSWDYTTFVRKLVLFLPKIERQYDLAKNWLQKVNIEELLEHFRSIWTE